MQGNLVLVYKKFFYIKAIFLYSLPCKHGADSSKTPKAKHIEVAIVFKRIRQNVAGNFRRNSGNHIKDEPGCCVPPSNLFWVVDEKISSFFHIGNKEG